MIQPNKDLFGGASYKDITFSDMIFELDREIKMRRHVYPKWVKKGTLNCVTADQRILALQAIRKKLIDENPTGERHE